MPLRGFQARCLISFSAGVLTAFGFAPVSFWPVTIVGIMALMAAADGVQGSRQLLCLGWAFGFGQSVLGLHWLAQAFHYQAGLPEWAGWLAVPLLAAYLGVFPALALAFAKWLAPDRAIFRILVFPAAWIIFEWSRGWLLTGFAWNPLGVIWIDVPLVARLGQWVGATGLSGLSVALAGSLLQSLQTRRFLFVLQIAALLLAQVTPRPADIKTSQVRVRVVQPNINQDEKWRSDRSRQHRQSLLALSGKPRRDGGSRFIFWPEAAVAEELDRAPHIRQQLAEILGPHDLLLTGGIAITRGTGGEAATATNSMFVIDSKAEIVARYDKAHLVPFGEYVPPFAKWLGLSRFAAGAVEFREGPGPRSLTLAGLPKVAVNICYEMTFPGKVVDPADRPAFIFNPSNDAWFGKWGPPQHLAQARLRAIEEGLPVIRSTSTGISAIIRPDGSVASSIPLDTAGFIDAGLPPPDPPTLFSRWGHWLTLTMAGLAILGAAFQRRRRRSNFSEKRGIDIATKQLAKPRRQVSANGSDGNVSPIDEVAGLH